jgi:hypothetical protein
MDVLWKILHLRGKSPKFHPHKTGHDAKEIAWCYLPLIPDRKSPARAIIPFLF